MPTGPSRTALVGIIATLAYSAGLWICDWNSVFHGESTNEWGMDVSAVYFHKAKYWAGVVVIWAVVFWKIRDRDDAGKTD